MNKSGYLIDKDNSKISLIDTIYPVGSIYLSINATNPSEYFGGTWEQITSDAYLKIVSSKAGSLGGTSNQHKIPISSMPGHRHGLITNTQPGVVSTNSWGVSTDIQGGQTLYENEQRMGYTGGNQPYYPYYYGVYVWKRTE